MLFLVFWAAWMSLLAFIWIRHPGPDHGDAFTDACVLSGGLNFDRFGIFFNWGLPLLDTYVGSAEPRRPYTHYPPGPWWIHQGLKTAGWRGLWQMRLVALIVTAVAAMMAMNVFCQLSGSRFIGALAAFFYMWSPPFAGYADSIYQFAYGQLTLFTFMWAWLAFERTSSARKHRFYLAAAAVLLFVNGWITFEHMILVPLFVTWRLIVRRRGALLWGGALIICVLSLVGGLRLVQNAAALGSVEAAVQDLLAAAQRRGGLDTEDSGFTSLLRVWKARLGGSGLAADQYNAEFEYPLLRPVVAVPAVALLVAAVAVRRRWGWPRSGLGNGVALLVAGAVWLLVMKQHAIVHRHLVMILMPGASLVLGSLCGWGFRQWSVSRRAPWRRLASVASAVLLAGFAVRMRSSNALNQLGELDRAARGQVLERRNYYQRIAEAAPALRDVRRLAVLGLFPQTARLLGRPFEFVEEVPARLGRDEALWLALVGPQEARAATAAWRRFGFPDVLSSPTHQRFVFRGRRIPGERMDVLLEGNIRVTRVRFGRTLDGRGRFVQVALEGPLDEATCRDLTVFCHLVDVANIPVQKVDVPLTMAIRDGSAGVSSHVLATTEWAVGARVVVGLWSASAGRPLRVASEVPHLMRGAELGPSREYIAWDPQDDGERTD